MTLIMQSVLEAIHQEDGAISLAEPAFDRQTLVFDVGPRAPRPTRGWASKIRSTGGRKASTQAAAYSAGFGSASNPSR